MNEADYAQDLSNYFAGLAESFDHVCSEALKDIHERLSNEKPPYPPRHAVTLARAVHVLAMRMLDDNHPAKNSLSIPCTSTGRHGLHLYWTVVLRINDAVNRDAKTGVLRLRDFLTAFAIQEWDTPSKAEFIEWESLAINRRRDITSDRQAVEIMYAGNWRPIAVHFDFGVVVSLAEFDAWAVSIGTAEPGEVPALLRGAEEQGEQHGRTMLAKAAARKNGKEFELNKFLAEPQPARLQNPETPAPVVPVVALGVPDKAGPVANWKMQIQVAATNLCLTLRQSGASPTKHSIVDAMAKWCRENDVKTDTKIYPSGNYLRTHVLGGKHWDVPN